VKAFILDRYGSADGVRAGDMRDPEVREDDVLVQVHAAGVNLLDSKIRNGEFKRILRYRLPLILGHDVAGLWSECGDSSPATKSTRGRRTGASVHSRSSLRSTKMT
jgi:NADPH:quinone reductase-like Zn-dependent oxidoreductase